MAMSDSVEFRPDPDKQKAWKPKLLFGGECGDMVKVRPCAEQYGDKTFLGVLLGEIAQTVSLGHKKEEPTVYYYGLGNHNPAIFVPELNTIIFGRESWWGKIKDETELRAITDDDINNVWYVRALEELAKRQVAEDE
jgi:hypothetical protein